MITDNGNGKMSKCYFTSESVPLSFALSALIFTHFDKLKLQRMFKCGEKKMVNLHLCMALAFKANGGKKQQQQHGTRFDLISDVMYTYLIY